MHEHTWHIYCTDIRAHSLAVFCSCGVIGEAQQVSSEYLQAALEVSAEQAQWEGPVCEVIAG